MAVGRGTDGLLHPPDGGANDHHAAPNVVTIDSQGVVSLVPYGTYNLDITLPRSDFQKAQIDVHGPKAAVYLAPSASGYEGHHIEATPTANEATSHGARGVGGADQYTGSYAAAMGGSVLTDYVYDADTGIQGRIAIASAQIIGTTLRLGMVSRYGGSAWLWIVGMARLL